MDKQSIEYLQDILISIHENLHELHERKSFADPQEFDHIEGKIQAYQEVLAILKISADQFQIPRNEIGL